MSSSHFCAANSAVQITSEKNTSHSDDFASWRWTNWLRCSSADVGNSSSFADRPFALNCALNFLTAAVWLPDVSLPRQNVTLPVASLDAATVGAFATPFVTPLACVEAAVPPPPPPPPLSLLPQATTNIADATISATANLVRNTIECTLLLGPSGPVCTSRAFSRRVDPTLLIRCLSTHVRGQRIRRSRAGGTPTAGARGSRAARPRCRGNGCGPPRGRKRCSRGRARRARTAR